MSIVVPNNAPNAYDGTITEMDAWLKDQFISYSAWAKANDSLLIVTFDEKGLEVEYYCHDRLLPKMTFESHDFIADRLWGK